MKTLVAILLGVLLWPVSANAEFRLWRTEVLSDRDNDACRDRFPGTGADFMISHYNRRSNTDVCYFFLGTMDEGERQTITLRGVANAPFGVLQTHHHNFFHPIPSAPTSMRVRSRENCPLLMAISIWRNPDKDTFLRSVDFTRGEQLYLAAPGLQRFRSAEVIIYRSENRQPSCSPDGS